ncbi:hypothetical protein BDV06DRAFT_226566 [Aspergillus oleicola]
MSTPYNRRRIRVTIIGAGISGILIAIKLLKHLPSHATFTIYEKSPKPGGTWFENRYASSTEIQNYLESVIRDYKLDQVIQYNSQVIHAKWDTHRGTWTTQVAHETDRTDRITKTIESEILINAGGILNNPVMPDIPGLDTFAGPILHTAAWDDTIDLAGKRVAVIGAGASAIQLLPAIQNKVSHADVYIRTPSWISPPVALPQGVDKGHLYSEEEKEVFRADLQLYLEMRKGLEDQFNGMFGAFRRDGSEQTALRARFEGRMKSLIKNEKLQKRLIPTFEVGCRRINPGEEYLLALQEDNVRPIFDPIREILPSGMITKDGEIHEADILITATGFDTSFRPRFPTIGLDGVDLQDLWETNPVSYFGIAVSGPLEATSDYISRLLLKFARQFAKSFNIHSTVQSDFDAHTKSYMQDTVWTGTCRSWFKNNVTGKVTAL